MNVLAAVISIILSIDSNVVIFYDVKACNEGITTALEQKAYRNGFTDVVVTCNVTNGVSKYSKEPKAPTIVF